MNTTQALFLLGHLMGGEADISKYAYTYILHLVVLMASLLFIIPFVFRQLRWVVGVMLQALAIVCFLLLTDHYSGQLLSSGMRRTLFSLMKNTPWEHYYSAIDAYFEIYSNHFGRYYREMPESWRLRPDYEGMKRQHQEMVANKENYLMRSFFAISAAIGGFLIGNRHN